MHINQLSIEGTAQTHLLVSTPGWGLPAYPQARINSLRTCQGHTKAERESHSIKTRWSIIIFFLVVCVLHVSCLFVPWRNSPTTTNTAELKALSGDSSASTVSNRPSWSSHLARPPPPPHNPPQSLISSYLSPGMRLLILKNTLSSNTLEKPRSALQKIGIPPRDLLTCVLKQGKKDKDLWHFGEI